MRVGNLPALSAKPTTTCSAMFPDESKTTNGHDSSTIGRVFENLTGYVDTKVNLLKLDLQLKVRNALVGAMHIGVLAITGLLATLFLFITLGLALNDWLDSSFLGFAIVTVIFLIPFLIALFNKDKKMFRNIADGVLASSDDENQPPKAT